MTASTGTAERAPPAPEPAIATGRSVDASGAPGAGHGAQLRRRSPGGRMRPFSRRRGAAMRQPGCTRRRRPLPGPPDTTPGRCAEPAGRAPTGTDRAAHRCGNPDVRAATAGPAAALRTPRPVAAPSRPAARPPAPTADATTTAPSPRATTVRRAAGAASPPAAPTPCPIAKIAATTQRPTARKDRARWRRRRRRGRASPRRCAPTAVSHRRGRPTRCARPPSSAAAALPPRAP